MNATQGAEMGSHTVRYFTKDGTLASKTYKTERGARSWVRKAEAAGEILDVISITADEY